MVTSLEEEVRPEYTCISNHPKESLINLMEASKTELMAAALAEVSAKGDFKLKDFYRVLVSYTEKFPGAENLAEKAPVGSYSELGGHWMTMLECGGNIMRHPDKRYELTDETHRILSNQLCSICRKEIWAESGLNASLGQ